MRAVPWRQRLSWQLWKSHFTVVVITLVALVASIVLVAGLWLLRQGTVLREPALDAQVLSVAIGNLVRRGVPEPQLSSLLTELRNGGLRMSVTPFQAEHGPVWGGQVGPPLALRGDLQNLDFIVVVDPSGRVVASSDRGRYPPGRAFPPAGESDWGPVVERALAGERDPARLSTQRETGLALGAYPIVDPASGQPVGLVALGKELAASRGLPMLLRAVAAFGVATTVVLAVSSGFALTFSALAAYLLSRRVSRRLQRLREAADAVARGDLEQRVDPGPLDEVGRLAEDFNAMAARLRATIADLEVEKERAEASLRARRELVANVSHELRTPLALIRGHVESLAMAQAAPAAGRPGGGAEQPTGVDPSAPAPSDGAVGERARYLGVVQREADHLSRLIDDLFALSTAEAGGLLPRLEPLPLAEVVGEVADAVGPIARRERQVTLINEVGSDAPAVLADRQRLGQVLANLVRNALRYTPEGGLISLTTEQRDGVVEVAVADTGLGIPPDDLPHLFERFYRVDPSRDRSGGGAGLGLAIVRELVESMGGQVAAESTPGQGSRFSFTLPLAPSKE